MWMPTHVQVTVQRAAGLLIKGKKTNDCFVTIGLGKTKYQTSIKEKSSSDVEWHEECDLPIPDQGNTAEIVLVVLHHNNFGIDEFLGRTAIPLRSLDIYERPKNKWYALQSKPGKTGNAKDRGHIEVKVAFTVKSGSLTDLSKKEKHKSSIGQLSHMAHSVGGSLLSLGSAEKRKSIKRFAKSIGSKMHLRDKRKHGGDLDYDNTSTGSNLSVKQEITGFDKNKSRQTKEDADPGVVSEDDDEFTFDDLSNKSSMSSLSQPVTQGLSTSLTSVENINVGDSKKNLQATVKDELKPHDEWESKLFGKQSKNFKPNDSLNRRSWDSSKIASQIEEEDHFGSLEASNDTINTNKSPEIITKEEKGRMLTALKKIRKDKVDVDVIKNKTMRNSGERIIIGGENDMPVIYNNHVTSELLRKFEGKSREDLILLVCDLQTEVESHRKKLKDLEDYLDDLLLRVMETTPRLLQNPYVTCKFTHKNFSS